MTEDDESWKYNYSEEYYDENIYSSPVVEESNDDIDDTRQYEEPTPTDKWIQQFDEQSNAYYYYNTVTGESAWDLPGELYQQYDENIKIEYSTDSSAQFQDENDHSTEYDYSADPAYWSSVYDDDSGQVYYYNSATQATQWEIPSCFDSGTIDEPPEGNVRSESFESNTSDIDSHVPFQHLFSNSSSSDLPLAKSRFSKRHSIAGPVQGDSNLQEYRKKLTKSKGSSEKSTSPTRKLSDVSATAEDMSPLMKHSTIHGVRSNSSYFDKAAISSSLRTTSISLSEAMDEEKEYSVENPDISYYHSNTDSRPGQIMKISDLSSISTYTTLQELIQLLSGMSIIGYVRSVVSSESDQSNYRLSWSPDLTNIPILESVLTSDDIVVSKKCFSLVRRFMDRASSDSSFKKGKKPLDYALLLLSLIMQHMRRHSSSCIVDEVYCQIIKQLIDNPSIESTMRGWQLIQLLLSTSLPSRNMLLHVLAHTVDTYKTLSQTDDDISQSAIVNENSRSNSCLNYLSNRLQYSLNSTSTIEKSLVESPLEKTVCAAFLYCLKSVLFVASQTPSNPCHRCQIPSLSEIQCLLSHKPMKALIHLLIPNKTIEITIDSWTTVKAVNSMIGRSLNETDDQSSSTGNDKESSSADFSQQNGISSSFGLFEVTNEKERHLEDQERIVDVYSQWNTMSSTSSSYSQHRLVYKIHYYLEHATTITNLQPIYRELFYYQSMMDVLMMRYPMTEHDALSLAVYHIYIDILTSSGSSDRPLSIPGNLFSSRYINNKIINISLSNKTNIDRIVTQMKRQLTHMIESKLSLASAQMIYLTILSSWKLYGSTMFQVESRTELGNPSKILLAISRDNITTMKTDTKTYQISYGYDDIISWGYSNQYFVIVCGSKMRPVKHYFRTNQGKEINTVMNVFSSHHKRIYQTPMQDESLMTPVVFEKSIFSVNDRPFFHRLSLK